MKLISTRKIFLLFILLVSSLAYAQSTVEGIVADSLTQEPLIGASVYFVGTGLGSPTDIEGAYKIQNIPNGKYKLRVSYVGYLTKEIELNFTSGRSLDLFIQLASDMLQGKTIVVSAQALGQAAAINQQLSSNTIVNVVSEQKIQELPDANAAEAIGRLPGVSINRTGGEANKAVLRGLSSKFSSVTIDGVKIPATDATERGVDLSTISQGSLSGIELFKALTADKDADAIAGSINLVTRKAPSQRLIRVDATGKYNALEKSANQYNFEGRYGERFFDDLLGVQVVGNIERIIRSHENYEYGYDQGINNYTDYQISGFTIRYTDEIRKRSGASLLLDFNTPDNGTIRFNNVFNQTSRNYVTNQRNYPPQGSVTYNYHDIENEINTFTSSLRGENNLFDVSAKWGLSYSQARAKTPFDWEMNWVEPSARVNNQTVSGMNNVPSNMLKGPVEDWVPYALNNFQMAGLDNAVDRNTGNFDKERTGYIDLSKDYTFSSSITGTFKLGGKAKAKTRYNYTAQVRSPYYLNPAGKFVRLEDGSFIPTSYSGSVFQGLEGAKSIPLQNFLGSSVDSRNLYDKYAMNPLIDRDALRLWRELNLNTYLQAKNDPQSANFLTDILAQRDDYSLTERVYAGYLMNTLNFGQELTFIAGVRIEQDNNDYTGKYSLETLGTDAVVPSKGKLTNIDANHTETTVLPNFQAIIKTTDFWNLRLAAYGALARPDFSQRLPKCVGIIASNKDLYIGNTDLKNAKAWNYEVQNQFYGNEIGLFSVSVFYKEIKDMFLSINGLETTGTQMMDSLGINWKRFVPTFNMPLTYNLHTQYNTNKPTKVWGLEVEHQANFRFLPGFLQNIILSYNFSIIRSETWVTAEQTISIPRPPLPPKKQIIIVEKKQKLEDQPEFFGNAALGYDYEGFSFRISVFHQAQYNSSFSSDSRTDNVQNSLTRWDISIKQKVTDNTSAFLNLYNITDAEDSRSYQNRIENRFLTRDSNRYGSTADLTLRVEF